ncbi:aminotransferase class III-fold pyridoxal phosphate-dependent enzyme [Thalassobaculum sp. OXR-137]|uniref:aspartate aminotransferase family protein n=1 Tax=Thalassobaculum sp. OXR-137 TaxID=3100173 RepID=UPI002AC9D900|nr:aminotransferase class III-fold pyridoxal phosphate-dependent enzyme [Thalassobaculum sp. OXR-137]WPZ34859.1 aminotransferase class III-fold pyridoxal phosphate-dependent enzyme [Thalassobaculum sp. OXR-137]
MSSAGSNATLEAAYSEAAERFTAANPKSAAIQEQALAAMPGGNTRTVLHYHPYPLRFARGEGCRLWDVDGHEYVDYLGEYTAGLYGHSESVIRDAIKQAADDGWVLGGPTLQEARLAEAIVNRFPALERVRFTNSGTEANMMALATARAFTGRDRVMVFKGGYHGGVLYFSGSPLNAPFDYVMGDYNDAEGSAALIREQGDRLAAVLVEPMSGSGGCLPGSEAFLKALRSATQETGALLIFDEVMTSRLSPTGLHGLLGITPDLISLGKYLGGGLSFGAFGGRADILAKFDPRQPGAWPHAGTFNNNVFTMSAGLAGLTHVYTPERAISLNADGDAMRARLQKAIEDRGLPLAMTGRGSMMALHAGRTAPTSPPEAGRRNRRLVDLMHLDLIQGGIYTARRGMMVLSLPMDQAAFDTLAAAFEEFLDSRRGVIEAALAEESVA